MYTVLELHENVVNPHYIKDTFHKFSPFTE